MLSELGIPSELGADSAWTFEPHGQRVGRRALVEAGMGRPRPSAGCVSDSSFLVAGEGHRWGNLWRTRRWELTSRATIARSTFTSRAKKWMQHSSITSPAWRVRWRRFETGIEVFVILCAMEELDERACQAMAARMDREGRRTDPDFRLRPSATCMRWSAFCALATGWFLRVITEWLRPCPRWCRPQESPWTNASAICCTSRAAKIC